jgi:GT2 family glycosyltransferase
MLATGASAQTIPVSVVVTNYNGLSSLRPTLKSLLSTSYNFAEIIVVDDGSTDGSQEWLRQNHPEVRLIELGRNTAHLNIVRNAGIEAATSRYVFLTDNDITVRNGCVEQLLQTMLSDPAVISVTPRLLDQDRPEFIYQSGNAVHFLGVSVGSHRGRLASDLPWTKPVTSFGGGIMLLDTEKLAHIGYFDEGYALGWGDDGEMHVRGAIAGFKSLHDPVAICLVEVRPHGTKRAYGQYHNRLRFMLTTYGKRTLIALAPGLILFELMVVLAALVTGSLNAYGRAIRATWRERAEWRRVRHMAQALRRVPDKAILRSGAFEFPGASKLPRPMQSVVAGMQFCTSFFWWAGYAFIA